MHNISKLIIALIILSTSLYALNEEQLKKIKIAYTVGKSIKAKDGMTFENTLPSIMAQESSWGKDNIGDKYDDTGRLKSLYDSSLGNFQIKLHTAKITILKYPKLKEKYGYLVNTGESTYKAFSLHKKKLLYYKKIIQSKKWNTRVDKGDKKAITTIKWAKKQYLIHYNLWVKASEQARQDTKLINKLMYDFKFGAIIAGHYLLSMYEQSCKKFDKSNAYWRAVGRYNGGWSNTKYHAKVMMRMKTVKKYL